MGMSVALQPLRGTKGFYDNSHPPTLIELTRPNNGSDLRAYLHLTSEFRPFGDRSDAASGCANLNLADSVSTSGSQEVAVKFGKFPFPSVSSELSGAILTGLIQPGRSSRQ
jgi:hypothetical protein